MRKKLWYWLIVSGLFFFSSTAAFADWTFGMGTGPGAMRIEGVSEILVIRKTAHQIKKPEDLSGRQIWVRKSSSYYQSLLRFNKQLSKTGLKPVEIKEVNDVREDEDILEMMNAGIIPMSVIDSHKGKFWSEVFEGIQLHPDIRFRENGQIAWAIRKKSPQLKMIINEFVKEYKKGTLLGNIIFKRYLKDNKYIRDNLAEEERKRFEEAIGFFKKYGRKYRFDPLNQVLFSFAAYNAGPAKIRKLRKQTLKAGLDPNIWFENVEVAAAEQIGRETVQYVSNIFKYYFAYRMLEQKYQKKDHTIQNFKSNAKEN